MVNLYDANEGLTGRTGGPYLDVLMREEAEVARAKAEGREPDLVNPPYGSETKLIPANQLLDNVGIRDTLIDDHIEVALQALVDDPGATIKVAEVQEVEEVVAVEPYLWDASPAEEVPVDTKITKTPPKGK